jgi:hypothetical protein
MAAFGIVGDKAERPDVGREAEVARDTEYTQDCVNIG